MTDDTQRETVVPVYYTWGRYDQLRYHCPKCSAVLYEDDWFCPTCKSLVNWEDDHIKYAKAMSMWETGKPVKWIPYEEWKNGTKKGTKKMKSIETIYKGYRFRSRLEARWAVFFDAVGAEWEYEPEGFVLSDGTKYLPDFLLHNVYGRGAKEIYVEIKGFLTEKDLHKIELFSSGNGSGQIENPIIIFGKIPEEQWIEVMPDDEEPWWKSHFDLDFSKNNDDRFYDLRYSDGDWGYLTEPWAKKDGGLVLDYLDNRYDCVDRELTIEAYRKARQARFEHGETPKVGQYDD